MSRLSNTHCIARPGRPMNGSSMTGRSNHRFTVTIGDDAIRRAAIEQPRAAAPAVASNSSAEREPRHGGDHAIRRPLSRRPPRRLRRGSSCTRILAGAPVRTVPPWLSMNARAGSAYIASSGLVGKRDRRRARIVAEHLRQHAREHRRRRLLAAAGSAPPAPADPTASRECAASGRCESASSRPSRPGDAAFTRRTRAAAPGARSAAAPPSPAPTGDRSTTARPSR